KFRFKSSSSRSKSKRDGEREEDRHRRHRHHRHHRDSHHRSKRHKSKHDRSPSPTLFEGQPQFSPDAAFRESLFDALGDDEGAAYWESVYGQPIHNYSIPSVPTGPNGELEQMSEEDYATYVRTKMWERTREGMIEEQERLRQERAKHNRRQKEQENERYERVRFEKAMEESLQRGRQRKRLKAWKTLWAEYLQSWEDINKEVAASRNADKPADSNASQDQKHLRNLLFWPVESGKRRDISQETVEEFMRHAPALEPNADEKDTSADLLTTLKTERVRWHPDKIQHRYGALGVDDSVIRSVTEVFQIIDQMWNDLREK
ncbi:hypothetical protein ASPWEDRAFT_96119, partial [Aspergillus wentii DTO 134E9]